MGRTAEVTGLLAEVLAPRANAMPHFVVVDGSGAAGFADALAGGLGAIGVPHVRLTEEAVWRAGPERGLVVVADGPHWRAHPPDGGWGTVVFLRGGPRGHGSGDDENGADVVVDNHDPGWPVIRRLDPALADHERWYLSENRAFFGVRAAGWDARFGDDLPAYAKAVADAGIRPAELVLDVGSGTGRALPALAAAVG
ncbi:MAG TPA: SAM-dependent methyltransferase, partial [Planosporangium sp.]|nr:SAM-dependent methyltransferase [Planosporangium sp.]